MQCAVRESITFRKELKLKHTLKRNKMVIRLKKKCLENITSTKTDVNVTELIINSQNIVFSLFE